MNKALRGELNVVMGFGLGFASGVARVIGLSRAQFLSIAETVFDSQPPAVPKKRKRRKP